MRFVIALSLSAAVLSACEPPGEAPPCFTLPDVIDFEKASSDGVTVTFPFTNRSEREVTLRVGRPSGSFRVGLDSTRLLPHGSALLTATLTAQDARLHVGEVEFIGGDECAPQTVGLRAFGLGSLLVAPSRLEFPAIDAGARVTVPVQLGNALRDAASLRIDVLSGASDAGVFTVGAPPQTFAVGDVVEVPVTFRALGNGAARSTLFVTATTPRHKFSEFIPLVAMAGVPKLTLLPSAELSITRTPLSSHQDWTFRFENAGAGESRVEVESVVTDGGDGRDLTVFPSEDTLVVTLNPTTSGPRQWTVVLRTADPAQPKTELSVSTFAGRYVPCAKPVVVSPGAFDVTGPWPRVERIDVTNPNSTRCLVTVDFDVPHRWLVTARSFSVDPGATFPFELTLNEPGSAFVLFKTYDAGPTLVSVRAQ